VIEAMNMDRDAFLKRTQVSRAFLEQRLTAEWGESKEALEKREMELKAFDAKMALLSLDFRKTTMWSDFVRKPPCWPLSD
jgi:hypothetical protein